MRLTAVLLAYGAGACGVVHDSPADGPDDAANTMLPCLVTGLCITTTPESALVIEGVSMINTDADSRCSVVAQTNGPQLCIVHVASFTVRIDGRLTTTGSRPLVIASTGNIQIDGSIDVSSDAGGRTGGGASTARSCTPATAPGVSAGGSGGGAGGTFAATGGTGGTGDTDQRMCSTSNTCLGGTAAPAFALSPIHGGCEGQAGGGDTTTAGGLGGASGGALYLVSANNVEVTGTVDAGGAGGLTGPGGGAGAGGGGGGSGGLLVLHGAAVKVATTAIVAANGGGGAEGAVQGPGKLGVDGNASDTRAPGGAGQQADGGDGGPGGARATTSGGPGVEARGGGGGGGGGVGLIQVIGTLTHNGIISPPPT